MKIYRYEQPTTELRSEQGPIIFLAGPTVRGHQPHLTSWREAAFVEFQKQGFDGVLVMPEYADRNKSDKGVRWLPVWEFEGLKSADAIMFWIPRTRELIGLLTNCELGYWMARERNKVVYGRPDDAYRIEYHDIMWHADAIDRGLPELPICHTLSETVAQSIKTAHVRWDLRDQLRQIVASGYV